MAPNKLSTQLQRFLFESVDSIGFLEALLLLQSNPTKSWTFEALARELRNNPTSVARYLKKMETLKLVRRASPDGEDYIYDDSASGFAQIVTELVDSYRVQRHKIIEVIYSPLKKARDFSEAFLLPDPGGKKEDNNG